MGVGQKPPSCRATVPDLPIAGPEGEPYVSARALRAWFCSSDVFSDRVDSTILVAHEIEVAGVSRYALLRLTPHASHARADIDANLPGIGPGVLTCGDNRPGAAFE